MTRKEIAEEFLYVVSTGGVRLEPDAQRIAEAWEVGQEVPEKSLHANGTF